MIRKRIRALFHPELYHGWGKNKKYFEGWYYKIINKSENIAFAIIPGIAFGAKEENHSFIQILDGQKLSSKYLTFSSDDFITGSREFKLKIGENKFTANSIKLNLPTIKGELKFLNQINWPSKWYSPGIMGPFAFVPFMECYHGILSMNHAIEGQLEIDGELVDFSGGKGYIEKDWGHSFPSAYIWMQSNHFGEKNISVKSSVAKIPWLGNSFVGFIAGVWFEKKLYQFTSYNSSKLIKSTIENKKIEITFENKKYRLEIIALRNDGTSLASPILGFMDGRISESMTSNIIIKLYNKSENTLILEEKGKNLALEVAGKIEEIIF